MTKLQLSAMTRGWFIGDFNPTAFKTSSCEVACKLYHAGDSEERHLHKIATEITLIISGLVEMNGERVSGGEIMILDPGEAADFVVLENTVTMVVKVPSVNGDKYSA